MTSYNKHKDRDPLKTIQYIRKELYKLGFFLTEEWLHDTRMAYSVRIKDEKTGTGTNGKGTTPAFALASAYAEFIERLSNIHLYSRSFFTYETLKYGGFYLDPLEQWVSADELLSKSDDFTKQIIKETHSRSQKQTKFKDLLKSMLDNSEEISIENNNEYSLLQQKRALKQWEWTNPSYGPEGMFITVPYYSVKRQTIVQLPEFIVRYSHGSNGMCAGNTREEALVQGFSEILERHATRLVLEGRCIPPEIPTNEINRYPELKSIKEEIEDKKEFILMHKDCSLGKNIPVVMSILIDQEEQRYCTNFGSHPDFPVAVERSLTELLQGFSPFSKRSRDNCMLPLQRKDPQTLHPWYNTLNQFTMMKGFLPLNFFSTSPNYEFKQWEDRSRDSNMDYLTFLTSLLFTLGPDIFVRDVSVTEIPSYKIVVPGISHVPVDNTIVKNLMYEAQARNILETYDKNDSLQMNNLLKAVIHNLSLSVSNSYIMGVNDSLLAIALLIKMKRFSQAALFAHELEMTEEVSENSKYYSCLKTYLISIANGITLDASSHLVNLFYNKKLADKVREEWFLHNPILMLINRAVQPDNGVVDKINAVHKKVKELQKNNIKDQLYLKEYFPM